MRATLETILSSPLRFWSVYVAAMAVLAWLCFGSLRHHLLEVPDFSSFADHLRIDQDPSYFFSPDKHATGRLLADIAKYAIYLAFGNSPAAFHLAVVAAHLLASLLLALLVYRLYAAHVLAMLTGLLFLLNVTHFQAVHHISALDYPLGLVCACAAWLCWEGDHKTRAWTFSLFMVLAVQAHPSMAALWLLPLYRLWQTRADRRTVYYFGATALPVTSAVIASVLLASQQSSTWHAIGEYETQPAIELVFGQINLMLFLTSRLLSTAHWVPIPIYSQASWEVFLGLAIVATSAYVLYQRQSPLDLGVLWMLVGLFPYVLLTTSVFDDLPAGPSRYLYVANAGSSLLLAAGLNWVVRRQRLIGVAFIVAIVASSYVYLKKVEAISRYTSGRSYNVRMEFEQAIECFEKAIHQGPDVIPLGDTYYRLCNLLLSQGEDYSATLYEAQNALPDDNRFALISSVTQSLSDDLHSRESNQKTLNEIVMEDAARGGSLRSITAIVYHNFGLGLTLRGDRDRAEKALQQALRWQPQKHESLKALSQIYFRKGLLNEAAELVERMLQIDSSDYKMHYVLGKIYSIQQKDSLAYRAFQSVLHLAPHSVEADKIRAVNRP